MAKTPEEKAADAAASSFEGQADVHDAKGNFVRRYSKTEHGPGFKKLAEMYASKIKGSVR